MGIRTKFNLVIICAFAIGVAVAAYFAARTTEQNARDEVVQQARLLLLSALSVRDYTDKEIAPLLASQLEKTFIPNTIPFYAAQETFKRVHASLPEYYYKEAALNPTNPADRATDWEADIINTFRDHSELKELITHRDTPTGRVLVYSRPLVVTEQSCLSCHGTADSAPKTMLAVYGRDNGFGWKLHQVVGAQVISVPMSVPLDRARDAFIIFMAILVGVFVLVMVLLNVMLHFIVIRPVVKISELAEAVSLGQMDVPDYVHRRKDEIGSLSASFNRMRRSLEKAISLLDVQE